MALLCGLWSQSNCQQGRETIVHLFEWKWNDVATECERILAPAGFCGVQISPPHENRIVKLPLRPWFERYQPVSYKLVTRSGNEQEFTDMVERCNKVGVRIYADVTLNHMAQAGSSGLGTAGSYYSDPLYPDVQFSESNFNNAQNCSSKDLTVHNYTNKVEVRNCRLQALNDLKIFSSHIQETQLKFLNKLTDIGVAGFRIDAAKHMWPSELERLYVKLHHLSTKYFPFDTRPFILHEDLVIDTVGLSSDIPEYTKLAKVTNYDYGYFLARVFLGHTENLRILTDLELRHGWPASDDVMVFIDDSASQRGYGTAKVLSNFDNPRLYKMANVFMLAHPYGLARVMSSYYWPKTMVDGRDVYSWMGPPADSNMTTLGVFYNNNINCQNGWICEHRWRPIKNMVGFRNTVGRARISNWWSNNQRQFAFARQGRGFVVMNAGNSELSVKLLTALPSGTYCDIISGDFANDKCTGKIVTVNNLGQANFIIHSREQEPMIAIHVDARLGSSRGQTSSKNGLFPGILGKRR
ncbi:alpha-amylase-like [Saccostrea echinata]|uniref:alpha-amylase-like n=1 Tax=Saccostrea echinata TaxID=191078 RepID=UPI002A829C88|nr:alpha-amylase-like [Saccostrea echinata]